MMDGMTRTAPGDPVRDALLAALKHAIHWHDQLSASDVAMMKAAVAKAEDRA